MMAGPGADLHAGGGPARHIPVLLDEVLAALAPLDGTSKFTLTPDIGSPRASSTVTPMAGLTCCATSAE